MSLSDNRRCVRQHDCGADYDGVGNCIMGYEEEDVKQSIKELKEEFRNNAPWIKKTHGEINVIINEIFGGNLQMKTEGKFILEGKKVVPCYDLIEWGRAFEKMNRIVKQETIGDIRISTVFLGLDHRFGEGKPILFETMIFGGKHDQYQNRCSTWEEAEEMHLKAKKLVEELVDET